MSEFKLKTCQLIERLPEQKIKLAFALLFETALNGNLFDNDMDYFSSIPGYLESLQEPIDQPLEECISENEVEC